MIQISKQIIILHKDNSSKCKVQFLMAMISFIKGKKLHTWLDLCETVIAPFAKSGKNFD